MRLVTKTCLIVALGSVGCGGSSSSDPPDAGGDVDSSGDVDAAPLACGGSCQVGQACNAADECIYAETLLFNIDEQVLQTPATLDRSASLSACTYHASEFATTPQTPTAMEGSCKVYTGTGTQPGAQESFQGDAGTVKIKTSLLGEITLTTPGGQDACYTRDLSATSDVFTAGETITFSATGGAHIPMFNNTVKAPDPLAGNITTVTRGQPLALNWSGAAADNFTIQLATYNDQGAYTIVVCTPPDNGSFTIPSAMTGYLRQDTTGVSLIMQRLNAGLVQPPGSMVAVDLFASSTYLQFPTYNP